MYYYLNCFFIYSIIGHFIEGFFYTSGESGILHGYWTPIYGLGVFIIICSYNCIKYYIKKSKIKKFITVFLIGSILLTILEYVGGIVIENLFHMIFWDYSDMKFNIGRYTSLEMALVWGLSAILLIYIIKPIMDKIIKKIPKVITWILIVLMIIDCTYTILKI